MSSNEFDKKDFSKKFHEFVLGWAIEQDLLESIGLFVFPSLLSRGLALYKAFFSEIFGEDDEENIENFFENFPRKIVCEVHDIIDRNDIIRINVSSCDSFYQEQDILRSEEQFKSIVDCLNDDFSSDMIEWLKENTKFGSDHRSVMEVYFVVGSILVDTAFGLLSIVRSENKSFSSEIDEYSCMMSKYFVDQSESRFTLKLT